METSIKDSIIAAITEALISRDYKDGLLNIADILHVELSPSAYEEDQPIGFYMSNLEVKGRTSRGAF
jgi:hypothetical protein